jgi:hypothetical protein
MPFLCLASGELEEFEEFEEFDGVSPSPSVARERASGGATMAMGLTGNHIADAAVAAVPGL